VCKPLTHHAVLEAKRVTIRKKAAHVAVTLDANEGRAPQEIGGAAVNTRWSFEYDEESGRCST